MQLQLRQHGCCSTTRVAEDHLQLLAAGSDHHGGVSAARALWAFCGLFLSVIGLPDGASRRFRPMTALGHLRPIGDVRGTSALHLIYRMVTR